MEVNYTLPGLLVEPEPPAGGELSEGPTELFGTHLRQLRVAEVTDWRILLRLNTLPAGAAGIGPPPAANGIGSHDGASLRAWWRSMLGKHTRLLESTTEDEITGMEAGGRASVRGMLALLLESQRLEDEVFARHLAESAD
jgi:hypothetical protein